MSTATAPIRRTLTIRRAIWSDIDPLMVLVRAHWPELPWGHLPLDEGKIIRLFHWCFKSDSAAAWVIDRESVPVGFLSLSLMPSLYTGELLAANPWWYVQESARGTKASLALLRTAERWAADHGASMTLSVHDPKIAVMLERLGYHLVDLTLRKG